MKRLIYAFTAIICSLLIYISCDDNEFLDAYNFPFEVELNNSNKGFTGQKVDITSVLTAKYNTSNVDHQYMMLSSLDGELLDSLDNPINSANWVKYKLNQKFYYLPKVAGDHTLSFKFKNKFGFEVNNQRKITVENSLFSFTSSVTSNKASIGVPKQIKLLLKRGDNQPKSTTYKFKFSLDRLSGELKIGDSILPQNEFIELNVGETNLVFVPDQVTDEQGGKVLFSAEDSFGQKVDTNVSLVVDTSSFDFTASALTSTMLVNETSQINFSVTPFEEVPNTTYKLKFEVDSQNGTLGDKNQNTWIDIKNGDFSMIYKGLTVGNHKIKFSVMNNWNSIETAEVVIEVKPYTFNFTAVASTNQVFINQPLNINFNISPNSGANYQEYQLKYEIVKGSGTLQNYEQGVYQNVSQGNFTIPFTPTEKGEITIKFTAKNQNNYEVERTVTLNVNVPSFDFTGAFNDNQLFVDVPSIINYNITYDKAIAQTFQIKYEVVEGTVKVENMVEGQYINTKDGASTISFKPLSAGSLKIKLTVLSSFGVTKEVLLERNVQTPDFTFNANLEYSNVNIGDPSKIFYNIIHSGIVDQQFQVKYEVIEGSAKIQGLNIGEWTPLTKLDDNFIFTSDKSGKLQIKLTVKNQYNIEKIQTLNVEVNVPSFEFVATSSITSANVNNPFDVIYSVTPADKTTQSFKVKYELVKGDASIEGLTLSYTDLKNLDGAFKITPKQAGQLTIVISIMNNYNVIKQQTININVLNPSFNFDVIPLNVNANVNFETKANVIIENTSSIDQNYEVKYEILTGNAEVKDMTIGIYKPFNQGTTQISFTPKLAQDLTIRFTAKNNYGVVLVKDIMIKVSDPDFQFKSNIIGNSTIEVNQTGQIENEIIDDVSLGMTYNLRATTSGQGVFIYNGQEHQSGTTFTITRGVSKLEYKPTGNGGQSHSITLVATNNFNISKTNTIAFNIEVEPKIVSLKLERKNKKSNCGGLNGCKYAYDYELSYNIQLPTGETLSNVLVYGQDRNGTYQTKSLSLSQYKLIEDRLMYHNQGFTEKPRPEYWNDSNNNFKITFTTSKGRKLELTNIRMTEYE